MKDLSKNAINILGEAGITWLNALPTIVETLSHQWGLENITPVDNMSYNYVAKALRHDKQPVVLKIGFDKKAILDEKLALAYFNGGASIRLLDYNEPYNALLLEQAIPGTTLKSLYPAQCEYVIDCYANTVKQLLNSPMNNIYQFPHIKDWLKAIDTTPVNQIPYTLLKKAIDLKNFLLSTMTTETVLHGDLHHENILKNHNTWIAIDPKGIVGEAEFEIAAFDFIHANEMKDEVKAKRLFDQRANLIAEKSQLSAERIKQWVFVRLVLSAVWFVQDNGDPTKAVHLATVLNELIPNHASSDRQL